MSLSGSKKQKTTTNQMATVAPSTYSAPYIDSAAAQFKPAFDAATANNAALMPKVSSVLDYYSGTLSGNRLSGNPYLQSIIDKTNGDITNSVSSRFSSAGRYGSGAYAGTLAKALADNESGLRYQDYSTERSYQDAAARGLLSGVGVSAALPQAAAGAYADQINALLGKYTTGTQNGTSTTKESGGILQSLLGLGGAALGGWASGGFK